MSFTQAPKGVRPHIALFGRTNVGKSSLINALTNQDLAIVSAERGTTTDPVEKAMELLPFGPVLFIDTPGLDDKSTLGEQRIARTKRVFQRTDLALLVLEPGPLSPDEEAFVKELTAANIPYLLLVNKCDRATTRDLPQAMFVSARTGEGIAELKDTLAAMLRAREAELSPPLVRDIVRPGECCLLVVPIDSAAPRGRLILPQQQVLRDLLEGHALGLVVTPEDVPLALTRLTPSLVVCDSQVFDKVAATIPADLPLTSFSILMARAKGTLDAQLTGIAALDDLKDNDQILMAEGCTHHRQCDDIGTVKIPRWMSAYTKKKLHFATSSGASFPEDLSPYALVVLCGGCMLNAREMQARVRQAKEQRVPVTNYGLCIAKMRGILERSIAPLSQTARGSYA